MKQNNVVWLPHLSNTIVSEARGWELDAYVVALEGWRRGLTLKWHTKDSEKFKDIKTWSVDKPGKLFSLSSEERTHYFFRTRGDIVTNEAVEIGGDKEKTKQYLLKAGVNTPKGKLFSRDINVNEIVSFATTTIGFPAVVKPLDGSYGKGVVTNIKSEKELKAALAYNFTKLAQDEVIVEKFINGNDYRIYVIDDKVVGAIRRTPANVIGDGESTIKLLIEQKNQLRKLNPRLISCLIKVDAELEQFISAAGYTLDSIPPAGVVIYLNDKSNISIGGDSEDVLDTLADDVKDVSVRALKAIPGLVHGAVDVMTEITPEGKEVGVVLEVNPTAQIGSLLYPMKGQARDIPAAIIDYYFPETIGVETEKEKLYFDFLDVLEPLVTRTARTTTVSPFPVGKLYGKKYIVSGDVQRIDYHRGLRKQAFERNLNGFVKSLIDGTIEVVVIGLSEENVNDYRNALLEDPERSEVHDIIEESYNDPVHIGFEVKADVKTQMEQLKVMNEELDLLYKELKITERQYKRHARSVVWNLTYPFRKLADLIKMISRSVR